MTAPAASLDTPEPPQVAWPLRWKPVMLVVHALRAQADAIRETAETVGEEWPDDFDPNDSLVLDMLADDLIVRAKAAGLDVPLDLSKPTDPTL